MGEDPYLASQLVAPLVQGIQSQNMSVHCRVGRRS